MVAGKVSLVSFLFQKCLSVNVVPCALSHPDICNDQMNRDRIHQYANALFFNLHHLSYLEWSSCQRCGLNRRVQDLNHFYFPHLVT